jgi:hypothetical protein
MKRLAGVFVLVLLLVALGAPADAALSGSRVTVSTTATLIADGGGDGIKVFLKNAGAAVVVLGASTVTSATGYELAASGSIGPIELEPAERLYGIVGSGSVIVHVIKSGE